MHQTKIRGARMALAIAASLLLLAAPALGEDRPWEQARWQVLYAGFSSSGEELSLDQRWLASQLHTQVRHGLEYSRSLRSKIENNIIFSIQGPLIGEMVPGFAFTGEMAPGFAFIGEMAPSFAFEVRF